jgi:hypothetical protein
MIPILYFIVFVVLLVALVRSTLRKSKLHFLLLKSLYPDKLKSVSSYRRLTFSYKYFTLGFSNIVWLICPIFYKAKRDFKESDGPILDDLYKNNKYVCFSFIAYVSWLTLGGTLFKNLIG